VVNPQSHWRFRTSGAEILNHLDDLYALIDFESSNPESYLLSVIGTTFLQNFPQVRNGVQYLPLLPLAIEQFDLRAYDVILFFPHRR